MKLKGVCFILILFLSYSNSIAQVGTWTWIHGSNFANSTGSYGTKGVPSASNVPPPRYQCAYWTDLQGNFWIFGGSQTGVSCFADMWKYTVSTNTWTWMSGSDIMDDVGVYGTKGVPSTNNYPRARGWGANCWTDSLGFLWLFGGKTNNSPSEDYGDLWKYNINTNEWTWVNGDDPSTGIKTPPYYGQKNVSSTSNFPGARNECKSGWVYQNQLYLFAGEVRDSGDLQRNDIWKYSIATDRWIWLGGDSIMDQPGVYGTKGVPSSTNVPPARRSYTKWKLGDKIFIFGGRRGFTKAFNDIWSFDLKTLMWTWENGPNIVNDVGLNPSANCENSNIIYPSARLENQTVQTSVCSKSFWTFGGADSVFTNAYSDLWLFKADSNKWVRVSGSFGTNFMGNYGTKGVPSSSNAPPAKFGLGIWSNNDTLYIFGGFGTGSNVTNDLWKYIPDPNCINYRLNGSIFIPPTKTNLCIADTAIVLLNKKADSLFVSPDTGVIYNIDSTRLAFKPTKNTNYRLIAYGSYCSQYSDTLNFSINLVKKDTTNISTLICPHDSLFFNNQYIKIPAVYKDTLSNQYGCDSFLNLTLTHYKLDTFLREDTICKSDSVLFNNLYRKAAGVYWDTLMDMHGCDSFVKLTLSHFKNDTAPTLIQYICNRNDSFLFNSIYQKQVGIYWDTVQDRHGCDSFLILDLKHHANFTSDSFMKICNRNDSFLFNGSYRKTPGISWDTTTDIRGCDSFIRFTLSHYKNDTTFLTDTICHEDTYLFNGVNINQQGIYWDTLVDLEHGCDSFIQFTLVHYTRDTGRDTGYICTNDSFWFNGVYRTSAGIYWDTLTNLKHGCDSIIRFSLILRSPPIFTIRTTVCNGAIVPFKGIPYSKDTIVWDTTRSKIHGCDSFIQFKLKYNDKDTDFHKHIICNGDSHFFNNRYHKVSGIYWDSFVNIYTCDSFIVDTLFVKNQDSSYYRDTICFGDSLLFNNQMLKIAGDYRDTLKDRYHCDSFIFFHLDVFPEPIRDTTHYYGCTQVIIDNVLYTSSQKFNSTYKNSQNCDSLYRHQVVHIKPTPLTLPPKTISYCDTFRSQGKKYFSSGNVIDTFRTKDQLNCDSLYAPLQLIRKISPEISITALPKRDVYRKGDFVELTVKKANHYLWNTGDTAQIIFEKLIKDTFMYQVIGWNEFYVMNPDTIYCRDTAVLRIITNDSIIARVPTAFTPNGDGVNDIIYCRGFGIERLISFKIYNRLGQLLFVSTNKEDGWNGYYKDQLQNSDTYFYTFEAESYAGKKVKGEGNFMLLH